MEIILIFKDGTHEFIIATPEEVFGPKTNYRLITPSSSAMLMIKRRLRIKPKYLYFEKRGKMGNRDMFQEV